MKSVLLIEDDPFLIDIYTTKLRESGFSAEVASDGESGLRKLKEKHFDLLILDIVLPKIDGWEILEDIKKRKEKSKDSKKLKIIVLSNIGQKEDVEKALAFGVDKYLIKAHYIPGEVIEEVKKLLR